MSHLCVPNPGEKWLGVAVETLADFLTFQADAGVAPLGAPGVTGQVALYEYYLDWTQPFNTGKAQDAYDNGMTPLITWEPWVAGAGVNQSAYQLINIINGDHDGYIDTWAAAAAAWPYTIFLRFAHEMNGDWYPWAEAVNCNRAGEYSRAWRHVHNRFANVYWNLGIASNVNWVWAPNVNSTTSTPLQGLYPGSRFVDWVGLDAYNWGDTQSWSSWQSFFNVFDATITELSLNPSADPILPRHPLMITETASTEFGAVAPDSKATWITDFFNQLVMPWPGLININISAFVWFNIDKTPVGGQNWTIQSSATATAAFAAGLTNPSLVLGQAPFLPC